MNKLLPFLFLLTGLSSCSSKHSDPTPVDPFLGHWQTESLRSISYDATGNIVADQTNVVPSQLDVAATTMTFSAVVNGKAATAMNTYTRQGEVLTLTVPIPTGEAFYARNLTASTFSFKLHGPRISGQSFYLLLSVVVESSVLIDQGFFSPY